MKLSRAWKFISQEHLLTIGRRLRVGLPPMLAFLFLISHFKAFSQAFEVRMGMNITSVHFVDQKDYNTLNTGGHIELVFGDFSTHYGFYENSNYRHSSYAGVSFMKSMAPFFRTGVAFNAVTGYEDVTDMKVTPIPLLVFEFKFDNVYPTFVMFPAYDSGFIGFQLKFSPKK